MRSAKMSTYYSAHPRNLFVQHILLNPWFNLLIFSIINLWGSYRRTQPEIKLPKMFKHRIQLHSSEFVTASNLKHGVQQRLILCFHCFWQKASWDFLVYFIQWSHNITALLKKWCLKVNKIWSFNKGELNRSAWSQSEPRPIYNLCKE